jgi:CRISPR-associated protein Cst2
MNDFANQARNMSIGEPQQVLIVFDSQMSRKACRYFEADTTDKERENILKELESRHVKYFLGDDRKGEVSVYEAYQKALNHLKEVSLFDPTGGDENILPFSKAFKA